MDSMARLSGDHWEEKLDFLRDCLSRVGDEEGRLVDLHYPDGLSCPEIVRRCGEGLESVKKRLQRRRLSLARCLEGKLSVASL